jgi:hypothetical protein
MDKWKSLKGEALSSLPGKMINALEWVLFFLSMASLPSAEESPFVPPTSYDTMVFRL